MKQLKTTLIALPLTVLLAACGGGGGSNDTASNLDDDSGTVSPSTLGDSEGGGITVDEPKTISMPTFTQRSIVDTDGVGAAYCLSSEKVVSANCYCAGNPDNGTNFGVLFACQVTDTGAAGACFPYLARSGLRSPPIQVTAVCAGEGSASFAERSAMEAPPLEGAMDAQVQELREQAAKAALESAY